MAGHQNLSTPRHCGRIQMSFGISIIQKHNRFRRTLVETKNQKCDQPIEQNETCEQEKNVVSSDYSIK